MFGLGMPEILIILALALIVIGPKKLPDLAKTLGRAMGEFKRSAQDFKQSLDVETTVRDVTDIEDITKKEDKDNNKTSMPEEGFDSPDDTRTDTPGDNRDDPLKNQTSNNDSEDTSDDQNPDDDKQLPLQNNSKSSDK